MADLSPMMKQYLEVKQQYNDTILFFRLGDFYEMFFEDAKIASKELELNLTGRDCGKGERAPMCGVPYHSSEGYIARLIEKGYKVAICEQMEDPSDAKGLVKRDVVRVITPGTVLEGSMLDETQNNFICSLFLQKEQVGICFCDISTGELYATEFSGENLLQGVTNELGRFSPKEILLGGEHREYKDLPKFIRKRLSCSVETFENDQYEQEICKNVLTRHFKKQRLSELELKENSVLVPSLGVLIMYLEKTQKRGLERINMIEMYNNAQFMHLDINTLRNLEILQTMRNNEKRGSLLWVLDKTKTAMGKRLIRIWLEQPLLSCTKITRRQNAVAELMENIIMRDAIVKSLSGVYDLERLMTRIVYGSANGKDLRSFAMALSRVPKIKRTLDESKCDLLKEINESMDNLEDVKALIETSITEDPPVSVKEGGIIKKGYNKEIDMLNSDVTDFKDVLTSIETRERQKTSIPKLKVGYNKIFGYYIEVTNSYKDKVPEEYIRKQTLSNCERYVTKELKELEGRILGSKDKAMQLEYILFTEIVKAISAELTRVQATAKAIAKLDVLCSFSAVSSGNRYCRPTINLSGKIYIKEGRHPVVEEVIDDAPFVPNDTLLDKNENRVAIITGPNMAGKSTYMRQTALIVLMAQIGCFVPANSAEIGLVDSIFTRVGASDDLASGQSTFMVEMTEVAQIMKNATENSLLVLDEIGRGTSTFDGMSLAKSILEYVSSSKTLGAKTLFATHYHELTALEDTTNGIKNYNVAVKKRGDDITFLRRIVRGGADDSYGIEVAKLAGVPENIVIRAKEILKDLENETSNEIAPAIRKKQKDFKTITEMPKEPTLKDSAVIEKMKNVDVNTLTPIEAMNLLFEISKIVKE